MVSYSESIAKNICAPTEAIVSAGESVESNNQELVIENYSTTEAMVLIGEAVNKVCEKMRIQSMKPKQVIIAATTDVVHRLLSGCLKLYSMKIKKTDS